MKNNRINLRGSDWAAVWDHLSTSGFKELSEQTLTSSVSCFLVEHLWTAVLVLPPGSEILTTCMLDHRDLKLEFNFREGEKVAGSKVWQMKDKVVTNISCPCATAWATVQVADTVRPWGDESTVHTVMNVGKIMTRLQIILSISCNIFITAHCRPPVKTAVWSLDESQRSSSHRQWRSSASVFWSVVKLQMLTCRWSGWDFHGGV